MGQPHVKGNHLLVVYVFGAIRSAGETQYITFGVKGSGWRLPAYEEFGNSVHDTDGKLSYGSPRLLWAEVSFLVLDSGPVSIVAFCFADFETLNQVDRSEYRYNRGNIP